VGVSLGQVAEIVGATALPNGVPDSFDAEKLRAHLDEIGSRYRFRRDLDSVPTDNKLRELAGDIEKRAAALVESMAALEHTPLLLQHLEEAANEWAANERATAGVSSELSSPFVGLEPHRHLLSVGGRATCIVDMRGADFVAAIRSDVVRLAAIAQWMAASYEQDNSVLHGLPAKGGRGRFAAIVGKKNAGGKPFSPEMTLIGHDLPALYETHFAATYGTSVSADNASVGGPGIRFVEAALKALGIVNSDDGKAYTVATVRRYWQRVRSDMRQHCPKKHSYRI
jgi:hypothetical protein